MIDFGHVGKAFRLDLSRASRHDNARSRQLSANTPDRLRSLPNGLAGDPTRVDNHSIRQPGGRHMPAHNFRLISVEPATERDHNWVGHNRAEFSEFAEPKRRKRDIAENL